MPAILLEISLFETLGRGQKAACIVDSVCMCTFKETNITFNIPCKQTAASLLGASNKLVRRYFVVLQNDYPLIQLGFFYIPCHDCSN